MNDKLKTNVLTLKSDSFNKHKWLYVDSSGDRVNNENEYPSGFGENHNHADNGYVYTSNKNILQYNVSQDAGTTSDFINKYKYVYFSIFLRSNFWDSSNGWLHANGKNVNFIKHEKSAPLEYNHWINVLEDTSDINKGKIKIDVQFYFIQTRLIVNFKYTGLVWWKKGSIYNHAVVVSSTNEKIMFV